MNKNTATALTMNEITLIYSALTKASGKLTKANVQKFQELHNAIRLIEQKKALMNNTDIDTLVSVLSEDAKTIEQEIVNIYKDKKVNIKDVKSIFDVAVTLKRIYGKFEDSKKEITDLNKQEIKLLLHTTINNI